MVVQSLSGIQNRVSVLGLWPRPVCYGHQCSGEPDHTHYSALAGTQS